MDDNNNNNNNNDESVENPTPTSNVVNLFTKEELSDEEIKDREQLQKSKKEALKRLGEVESFEPQMVIIIGLKEDGTPFLVTSCETLADTNFMIDFCKHKILMP